MEGRRKEEEGKHVIDAVPATPQHQTGRKGITAKVAVVGEGIGMTRP